MFNNHYITKLELNNLKITAYFSTLKENYDKEETIMNTLTYLTGWHHFKTCGKQLNKCLERDVWP